MRIFILLIFSLIIMFSTSIRADNTEEPYWVVSPMLKLKILPSFTGAKEYEVSRHSPYTLKIVNKDIKFSPDNVPRTKEVSLSKEEHKKISVLLTATLDFPLERISGRDGSTWILESGLYQSTKISFWSPTYKTKERGYSDLIALEAYLKKLETNF